MNWRSLQDPAVDSVSVRLVEILTRKSGRLAEPEMRNALHSVPLLATERQSTDLLVSLRPAQDLVAAIESTGWRPVLRHWKSRRATAVAS